MGIIRRALAVALTAVMVGMAAGTAVAQPVEQFHFDETFTELAKNFCGVSRVHIVVDAQGSILVNSRGGELGYVLESEHFTTTYTNLTTGKSMTEIFNNLTKDMSVTDNGDGTLTVLQMATGSLKVYGEGNQFLYNDPGQIRFELLIDHGGTLFDPSDDEILDFQVVRGSTGRSDLEDREFCDVFLEITG